MSFRKRYPALVPLLVLVAAVRVAFLLGFHHRVYSGPSTQYEQAFVAMNLLAGRGVSTFREPPAVTPPNDPATFLDPERFEIRSSETIPYIKEVPGYAFFLAGLWKITGVKLWIFAQVVQVLFELFAAWSLYALTRRFFGTTAAKLSVLVFAFLFFEARASIIPYKDIFLLYGMLVIAHAASRIYFREGRAWTWFLIACLATGVTYYFMPSILLYPLFLIAALALLKRIRLRTAAVWALIAIAVVGAMVGPYQSFVRAHRNDPGVTPPLLWYRFWLGTQVRAFYSTEEERFQDYFKDRRTATGRSIEEISKEDFLAYVKAHPLAYAGQTAKKLLFGTFLVYANAGDAAYTSSWSYFKTQNPGKGFAAYADDHPARILGMLAGTASSSILFPLALIALFLLKRERKATVWLFLFHIPLYYLLLHMFFHYEARYLTGTLAGYLPLAGYVLSRIFASRPAATTPET
jgi:4-amino-4-deoxy-L-arabinose transferase-like glycosyltransferase